MKLSRRMVIAAATGLLLGASTPAMAQQKAGGCGDDHASAEFHPWALTYPAFFFFSPSSPPACKAGLRRGLDVGAPTPQTG